MTYIVSSGALNSTPTNQPVVMHVENSCHSLGRAGFQTPQLTVFGKMGKIGCQSAMQAYAQPNCVAKLSLLPFFIGNFNFTEKMLAPRISINETILFT